MKRLLRKIIYITLGIIDSALARPASPFILCYHSISDDNWRYGITREMFETQMKYLADSGFKFVTLKDIEDHIRYSKFIPQKSVAITFDDGYRDILRIAPVVKYFNIKPTAFILSDTKNANRVELDNKLPFLSPMQIKSLSNQGWEIGGHSATHPNFANLKDASEIKKELKNSKIALEKLIGKKINYFAYPKGRYHGKVRIALIKAGYKMALSMDDDLIRPKANLWAVPRIGVDRTHTMDEFKALFVPSTLDFRRVVKNTPIINKLAVI